MTDKQAKKQRKTDHLPKWKKGQSGNPNGRPKKEACFPDILREQLAKISDFDPEGKRTNYEMIVIKAIQLAIGGDQAARTWIADRTEGRALERIEQKIDLDEIVINE